MSTGPSGRFAHFLHKFQLYLTNNVEFTEKEKKEIYFRRISYFAFLFVVVLIGLPVCKIDLFTKKILAVNGGVESEEDFSG
uniref:Uncharacterized protein n=1 Tax=Meloidogyne javanica TaxID=6303 RepID=A0A915MNW8_MELJA